MLHNNELGNFKQILLDYPKDIEKLADLLDRAVVNLKEENRTSWYILS